MSNEDKKRDKFKTVVKKTSNNTTKKTTKPVKKTTNSKTTNSKTTNNKTDKINNNTSKKKNTVSKSNTKKNTNKAKNPSKNKKSINKTTISNNKIEKKSNNLKEEKVINHSDEEISIALDIKKALDDINNLMKDLNDNNDNSLNANKDIEDKIGKHEEKIEKNIGINDLLSNYNDMKLDNYNVENNETIRLLEQSNFAKKINKSNNYHNESKTTKDEKFTNQPEIFLNNLETNEGKHSDKQKDYFVNIDNTIIFDKNLEELIDKKKNEELEDTIDSITLFDNKIENDSSNNDNNDDTLSTSEPINNDIDTDASENIIKEKKEIKKNKKYRIKWGNIFIALFTTFCIIGLGISIVNIIVWKFDNMNTKKQIEDINNKVDVTDVEDNENVEIIEQEEEIPQANPYWDYIKMNLINVDFSELKKTNSDTVGWIQVGGTNINYPFVQGKDNKYYLSHAFDKSGNQSGWAFLDYRNSRDEYDKNTIIYGHDLSSGAIFGTLVNILHSSWQTNTDNHIVKLSTEHENTLWQVFSVYHIPTTSDYLKINFSSSEQFTEFTQMLIDRSEYNFNTTVSENDKILTLSTCYINIDNKTVLHAKLIKREAK